MDTSALQRGLRELQSAWIGRSTQIEELWGEFWLRYEDPPIVLVHGPSGTGKSSITRDVLSKRGYCVSTLGSLEASCSLAQLWTFVLSGWQRELQKTRAKPSDIGEAWDVVKRVRQATSRPLCLLVDALDSGVNLDLISALLEFRNRSEVHFGIIFISACPWSSLYPDATHLTTPQHIAFPAYDKTEILQILQKYRPENLSEQAFNTVLHSFVKPALHSTKLLTDAQTLLEMLLANLPMTDSDNVSALVKHLHKECRAHSMSLAENYCGAPVDVRACTGLDSCTPAAARVPSVTASLMDAPRLLKLLVLAAHIAGNNRPAANRRVFSHGQTETKRKGNAMGAHRLADAIEEEVSLQGQVFTAECWLQVFFKLVEQDRDPSNCRVAQPDALSESMEVSWLHSQMKQLASIHIVKQSATSGLDGMTSICYTSEVSHSWAESLASSVSLNLKHFLVYV